MLADAKQLGHWHSLPRTYRRMPASLAELMFPDGVTSLHCPATGRLVFDADEGFDFDEQQSPHLRFVIDWVGEAWVARPRDVPSDQAAYQRRLVDILGGAEGQKFASQNALVEACREAMPPSALVFELLDPPQGSSGGEICYVAFDLARISYEDAEEPRPITLAAVQELASDG